MSCTKNIETQLVILKLYLIPVYMSGWQAWIWRFLIFLLCFNNTIPSETLAQSVTGSHDSIYTCRSSLVEISAEGDFDLYQWSQNGSSTAFNISSIDFLAGQDEIITVAKYRLSNVNLIQNGSFAEGNMDFTSDYRYVPGGTFDQGSYAVLSNPQDFNIGFLPCEDHSPNDDLMMVIDGSTIPGDKVWCQDLVIQPATSYALSTWTANLVGGNPSLLKFTINGDPVGDTYNVGNASCFWLRFFQIWNSGTATRAEICITNQNTLPLGNDLALDDISLFEITDFEVDTFSVFVDVPTVSVIDTSICSDRTIFYQGQNLSPNNQYSFEYTSRGGCDSNIIFNVNVSDTIWQYTRIDSLCIGDTLYFDNIEITSDTTICNFFNLSNQCDSLSCLEVVYLSSSSIAIESILPSCPGLSDGILRARTDAGLPPYSFQWTANGNIIGNANGNSIQNLTAGDYSVQVTDGKGCVTSKRYQLQDPPAIDLEGRGESPTCFQGSDGKITINATGGAPPYEFGIIKDALLTDPVIRDLESGSYQVYLQDQNGCLDSTEIIIPEGRRLFIELGESRTISLGEGLSLAVNHNGGNVDYAWRATNELSCSGCPIPSIEPFQDQWIYLQITDSVGCTATDSLWIMVDAQYELYLPNSFSPNGDGVNDLWQPFYGQSVEQISQMIIYDRWGGVIFSREGCNLECAWNGQNAGEGCDEGVYVYYVTALFKDGQQREFAGSLTLLR